MLAYNLSMGSTLGKKHTKTRQYLTPLNRKELIDRYLSAQEAGAFLKQSDLAADFNITQVAVSKILRAAGVKTRTPTEASPTVINVAEAARVYIENPKMRLQDVGELYGVGWSAVRHQLLKIGVPLRGSKDYPKYTSCDRDFFATVDATRAYFAGFIAADGYITKSGRAVNFGVHPKDTVILENLRSAGKLDQPIIVRPNNFGKLYSWLSICRVDWVRDLEKNYNIVNAKSLILKPPDIPEEVRWHFIRGYFDGDGHAGLGGVVNFVCGSPEFIEWLIHYCGIPGYTQIFKRTAQDKETYVTAQSIWYCSKESSGRVARLLYKDSTPETRLDRKFKRLSKHLAPLDTPTAPMLETPHDT